MNKAAERNDPDAIPYDPESGSESLWARLAVHGPQDQVDWVALALVWALTSLLGALVANGQAAQFAFFVGALGLLGLAVVTLAAGEPNKSVLQLPPSDDSYRP